MWIKSKLKEVKIIEEAPKPTTRECTCGNVIDLSTMTADGVKCDCGVKHIW